MAKKKKKKSALKRILLLVVVCYGSYFGISTYLLSENTNPVQEETVSTIHEEVFPQTGDPLIDNLYPLSLEDERILTIIENKEEYPDILLEMLGRNIDMIDYILGYPEKKGNVYTTELEDIKKGNYPLLLQYDTRWGYASYGNSVIAINGCGPTAISIIVAGLTGRSDVTPSKVASLAEEKGYYVEGIGTSWSLMTEGVNEYGITGKQITLSRSNMTKELKQNHPIIASMKPGDFTTTGHFISIVGIKDGKFIIRDSNSKERSNKLWSYDTLAPQNKNLWTFKLQD